MGWVRDPPLMRSATRLNGKVSVCIYANDVFACVCCHPIPKQWIGLLLLVNRPTSLPSNNVDSVCEYIVRRNALRNLREAVELARRKLSLEDAVKAKKAEFVAGLQAGLNEGGGYRKTPLVVEDFDEEQQEMLRGLEVRVRSMHSSVGLISSPGFL